jgi:hypothetical protein
MEILIKNKKFFSLKTTIYEDEDINKKPASGRFLYA